MNVNRRTLLKSAGGTLTILPIAGCLSSSPSEKLGETKITKENDTITLLQNVSSTADSIQLNLKYESTITGETGVVNSFSGDELTELESQYKKSISKENVFEDIPEDEPVELFAEAQLEDYTTQSTSLETSAGYSRSTYHMLKYETDSVNYIDTDEAESSREDYYNIKSNTLHVWESDGMIHYKIAFFIPIGLLEEYYLNTNLPEYSRLIPFFFDLEVPKKEKEALQEATESDKITWKEFQKEVSTEIGDIIYYETDLIKEFANQIENQINQYKTDEFTNVADIKLLLSLYDDLIEYDYGTLRGESTWLKYFSQILYDKSCICQGTTFSIAGILHNLGYDVGMQVFVEPDREYPNGYHIQPTVNPRNDTFERLKEEYPDQYKGPDKILDGLPEEKIKNQVAVYPEKMIGKNSKEVFDSQKSKLIPVKRVQMEYLEADS